MLELWKTFPLNGWVCAAFSENNYNDGLNDFAPDLASWIPNISFVFYCRVLVSLFRIFCLAASWLWPWGGNRLYDCVRNVREQEIWHFTQNVLYGDFSTQGWCCASLWGDLHTLRLKVGSLFSIVLYSVHNFYTKPHVKTKLVVSDCFSTTRIICPLKNEGQAPRTIWLSAA